DPLAAAGGGAGVGRLVGAAGGADEPGRRAAVGPLARPARAEPAGGGERLLPGVSVPGAADVGAPVAAGAPLLAAAAAQQMAGGGPARAVPVGLRGVRSVG